MQRKRTQQDAMSTQYILANTSNTLTSNKKLEEKGDRQVYERNKRYTNNKVIVREFSRRRNYESSTLRTSIRLKTCAYKRAR